MTSPKDDTKGSKPASAYIYMAKAFFDLNLWQRQRTEYPQMKVIAHGVDGVRTVWEVPTVAMEALSGALRQYVKSGVLRVSKSNEPLIEGPPTGEEA